ncbi:MAG: CBS domain-containing protein [Deltaproteobacteria bacterium]|nr:CBS domain-containing protein [Deltaproteobacteria bacterium]
MICPFCGEENIQGQENCIQCGEDLTAFEARGKRDKLERSLVKDALLPVAQCEVLAVSPNSSIESVAKDLNAFNRSCLVVEGKELKGIVTVRDIFKKAMFKDLDLSKTPVSQIMTPNPETLGPKDSLAMALNKMSLGGYRHIPIILGPGRFSVISVRDILAYLVDQLPED